MIYLCCGHSLPRVIMESGKMHDSLFKFSSMMSSFFDDDSFSFSKARDVAKYLGPSIIRSDEAIALVFPSFHNTRCITSGVPIACFLYRRVP